MTRHFELTGGGKQGRFEEELTVLRRIHAKRPCFPPQSKKSNNVILSEAKDLMVLYIDRLRNVVISSVSEGSLSLLVLNTLEIIP